MLYIVKCHLHTYVVSPSSPHPTRRDAPNPAAVQEQPQGNDPPLPPLVRQQLPQPNTQPNNRSGNWDYPFKGGMPLMRGPRR
ncbi:hypothetical protein MiSe_29410 [Microseira wollei NIES-4236]|uniref:Uncharacterized protein n=1 Tax=Microseira wollei NIES-4236 TaxID=2530354 RepID=A0AAV3XFG7_9CYAN|nr:hypothetical protein MiSe_29410 [Microseira wollei NIES-4236]